MLRADAAADDGAKRVAYAIDKGTNKPADQIPPAGRQQISDAFPVAVPHQVAGGDEVPDDEISHKISVESAHRIPISFELPHAFPDALPIGVPDHEVSHAVSDDKVPDKVPNKRETYGGDAGD